MITYLDHRKISTFLAILYIALCFSPKLNADGVQDDAMDDYFYSEIPTVLTISRLEQPKSEAPSAVTIIDKDMIRASGIREIAEILNLVPGFIVGHYTGNKPVVTYHGLGSDFNRQLQVLIDGRSVFIPSFGGIPWENLPVILEDIEKVEITRGPNAASYGSNSFLAAINIITTEAFQNTGTQVSVAHSDREKDIDDVYFRYNKQSEDYDWGISFKSKKDNGFQDFNTTYPKHDGQQVNQFNIRSNFLIKDNSQWSVQVGQSSGQFDKGDGGTTDIFREEKAINRFQTLAYEESNHDVATIIKLFHTEHDTKDSFEAIYFFPKEDSGLPVDITTPASINFNRFSERSELEIQSTIDWSKNSRLVLGGSIRKDTVDSFFLLGKNQKQSIDVKRLFAHSEYKLNKDSIINIGGMLEESDVADNAFSPRIAWINHLNPLHTLRFSYSQAYRNPILFELYGRWAFEVHNPLLSSITPLEFNKPNPDLEPEEIKSFEIGLNSQLSPDLETDIKLYHYDISSQIILDRSTPQAQYINSALETNAKGIEMSLSFSPTHYFLIKSGLNFIKADSIDANFTDSFPESTAFMITQYDINKDHTISGTYHYISSHSWIDSSQTVDSIHKLDLRYAYQFAVNNNTPFMLELIGQNLLSDYADYIQTNIQSKSFYLKLSSHF